VARVPLNVLEDYRRAFGEETRGHRSGGGDDRHEQHGAEQSQRAVTAISAFGQAECGDAER